MGGTGGNAEHFKALAGAYAKLKDDAKRRDHDLRSGGGGGGGGGGFGGGGFGGGGFPGAEGSFSSDPASDFFRMFAGQVFGEADSPRGRRGMPPAPGIEESTCGV